MAVPPEAEGREPGEAPPVDEPDRLPWPLVEGPAHAPIRPDPVGRLGGRRREVPRRHRPRHVLWRQGRGRPRRRRSWPPVVTTTTTWAGSATCPSTTPGSMPRSSGRRCRSSSSSTMATDTAASTRTSARSWSSRVRPSKPAHCSGYEGRTGRASGCHLHYGLFSPTETDSYTMDPVAAKRMKLPGVEIARIDPQLVLPQAHEATREGEADPERQRRALRRSASTAQIGHARRRSSRALAIRSSLLRPSASRASGSGSARIDRRPSPGFARGGGTPAMIPTRAAEGCSMTDTLRRGDASGRLNDSAPAGSQIHRLGASCRASLAPPVSPADEPVGRDRRQRSRDLRHAPIARLEGEQAVGRRRVGGSCVHLGEVDRHPARLGLARGSRPGLAGRPPRSYSARISASARHVGRRSRIACHASADARASRSRRRVSGTRRPPRRAPTGRPGGAGRTRRGRHRRTAGRPASRHRRSPGRTARRPRRGRGRWPGRSGGSRPAGT